MMKVFLCVFTFFTVSTSWAQTAFIEKSAKCENGNSLQTEVSTTAEAKFSVAKVDEKNVLIREVGDGTDNKITYSLSPLGLDRDTQQPSYLAFSDSNGYFIVIINSQNTIISIIENDRDLQKCEGGLVVVNLIAAT